MCRYNDPYANKKCSNTLRACAVRSVALNFSFLGRKSVGSDVDGFALESEKDAKFVLCGLQMFGICTNRKLMKLMTK